MDAFWTAKLGQIIVGAIAGGAGFLLLLLCAKLIKLSTDTGRKVAVFGAILCAIVAVRTLGTLTQPSEEIGAMQKVDATISRAIEEAKPADGKSSSEVLRAAMQKKANDEMSLQDGRKKLDAAANQFLGFYLVNARTRPEYCKALGVNLVKFPKDFEKVNERELKKARRIQATSPEPDEDKFYLLMKPTLMKTIAFSMKDQAAQLKITEIELCEVLEANSAEVATGFRFSEMAPIQAKVLLDSTL